MLVWCWSVVIYFFFNDTATTEIYTLSLHDALPIYRPASHRYVQIGAFADATQAKQAAQRLANSGLPKIGRAHV